MAPETMLLIAAGAIIVIAILLVLSCLYNTMSILYVCVRGIISVPVMVYNHPRRTFGMIGVVALVAGAVCLALAIDRRLARGSHLGPPYNTLQNGTEPGGDDGGVIGDIREEASDALDTVRTVANMAIKGLLRLWEHRKEVIEELETIVTSSGPKKRPTPSLG
jgi:hypothetical protein